MTNDDIDDGDDNTINNDNNKRGSLLIQRPYIGTQPPTMTTHST